MTPERIETKLKNVTMAMSLGQVLKSMVRIYDHGCRTADCFDLFLTPFADSDWQYLECFRDDRQCKFLSLSLLTLRNNQDL